MVKVLKSFVKYERKIFESIIGARSFYLDASSVSEKEYAVYEKSSTFKLFFSLSETYSEVKIK